MQFRVWGTIDGVKFDQVFSGIAEWRAERRMIEQCASLKVIGMASVEVAA